MLNLDEYLDRRPSQLSGGQRQRVAMGRAIVREPELFLFDEPLSNLDAKLRNQMRIEIRALQRRIGATTMYGTHDQVEAMTMAERIIVLSAGRSEQIGTPADIYNKPSSTFVASFMGAPPMNLLPGKANGNGHATIDGLDHAIAIQGGASHTGPVHVGIRPETVTLGTEADGIPFQVDIVEDLGASRLLHGQLGSHQFVVNAPNEVVLPGTGGTITMPPDAIHLFDAATGRRI